MTSRLSVTAALSLAQQQGLPRGEAQYLLQALLGQSRAWLIQHDDALLSPEQSAQLQDWLQQRLDAVPLAYLQGHKEFYGLKLRVTRDTLVPRPDTEVLVAWALECLQPLQAPCAADLGTGSGAIALAIKSQRPDATVHATDLSPAALAVAQSNAQALGLPLHTHPGSWWGALPAALRLQLAVSNPPYIRGDDPHLAALRHEPRQALTPEGDGLADLRTLVQQAPAHLLPGAWLLLEHGYDQGPAVAELLRLRGFEQVQTRQDLAGTDRCSGGRWPG
ncbi:peptide chain release factor N(5)-glutamine methyltransferase [Roseateles sp. BYS180W]|uniref:Release factor glutamine methyltransferase n=1 Tax=Roseateles rivi TaxID=3299028 RepID=A0ABW7FRW2_9BURK